MPISLRRAFTAFASPPHGGWAPISTLHASTTFASPPHGGWVPKSYLVTLRSTTNRGGKQQIGITKQIQAFIKLKTQAPGFYNIMQSMCEQPLQGFTEVPKGLGGSYRVHKPRVPNGPASLQNSAQQMAQQQHMPRPAQIHNDRPRP